MRHRHIIHICKTLQNAINFSHRLKPTPVHGKTSLILYSVEVEDGAKS